MHQHTLCSTFLFSLIFTSEGHDYEIITTKPTKTQRVIKSTHSQPMYGIMDLESRNEKQCLPKVTAVHREDIGNRPSESIEVDRYPPGDFGNYRSTSASTCGFSEN